jgi:hypothetical protein
MGAIVIRTRYDEGTESAEVATSVLIAFKKVKPNKDEKILKFIRVVLKKLVPPPFPLDFYQI